MSRGSKQRGLLTSFWANRYKVSKFGRDRAVELHRSEFLEDPQYGERVHELSGKRLLCHCRATERCHAENLQGLFRKLYPCAFDVSKSQRAPLSSELNLLAKAREERVATIRLARKGKAYGHRIRGLNRALGSRRSEVSASSYFSKSTLWASLSEERLGFSSGHERQLSYA